MAQLLSISTGTAITDEIVRLFEEVTVEGVTLYRGKLAWRCDGSLANLYTSTSGGGTAWPVIFFGVPAAGQVLVDTDTGFAFTRSAQTLYASYTAFAPSPATGHLGVSFAGVPNGETITLHATAPLAIRRVVQQWVDAPASGNVTVGGVAVTAATGATYLASPLKTGATVAVVLPSSGQGLTLRLEEMPC